MKTTKKQFCSFIKHCERFRTEFGLLDWNIYYRHEKIEGAYSDIDIDLIEKTATIRFNTDLERSDFEKNWIFTAAKHEMLHLLTGRLSYIANARCVTSDEIRGAVEGLIHSLENII